MLSKRKKILFNNVFNELLYRVKLSQKDFSLKMSLQELVSIKLVGKWVHNINLVEPWERG